MPSNSRKTFLPMLSAGILKCFLYQAMPVERSLMSLRKASSSFQACGVVIFFQPLSSKPGFSAPAGSPTNRRQSELKLYLARGLSAERQNAENVNESTQINNRSSGFINKV